LCEELEIGVRRRRNMWVRNGNDLNDEKKILKDRYDMASVV
jgi:hypothetical protein